MITVEIQRPSSQHNLAARQILWPGSKSGGSAPIRTIVIVGGGFSGSAVAINLLRAPQREPLRVVLVDRAHAASGLAYGSGHSRYLLNVPAARMSASSDDPLEFLAFAQRALPDAKEDDFLPRDLYGQYLESSLTRAAAAAAPHVQLQRLRAEVIAVARSRRSPAVELHLADGGRIAAANAVLAPGNPPPAPLPGSERLREEQYLSDPWQAADSWRRDETTLIVGTGLTMADVVLTGARALKGKVTLHAISRHGLSPAPQTNFPQVDDERYTIPLLQAAALSLPRLVRAARALAENVALRGGDWHEAIGVVRTLAPTLWQRLGEAERKRFLRHVRPYWEVHRHRLPPRSWTALHALGRSGTLHIHAGRILQLESAGRQVRVTWRARGASHAATLLVDRVINCTGPDYDARRSRERLLRSLIAQGMALADPLGLGLVTAERGALVDASGRAADDLYYIGPMLRPRHWETTAVQELRVHAEELARHLTVADVADVVRTGRPRSIADRVVAIR